MERLQRVSIRLWMLVLSTLATGCAALHQASEPSPATPTSAAKSPNVDLHDRTTQPVQQASFETPAYVPPAESAPNQAGAPFSGMSELAADALVEQVLARNPSLPQMIAAWQVASARYPQVTSLEDPMFRINLAPDAIGHLGDGNLGYTLELSQKYPWPGKLRLRGENALAEASAAGNEVDNVRLQLVESAKDALYEYYLVYRALEVNEESLRLLRDFRANAATRYRAGLVAEQDVLQADVEIGRQQERQETLKRMREVAIARIDTLLNLAPDTSLPAPPKEMNLGDALPEAPALRNAALTRRPDLQALANRIRAEEAALGLAYKEYYPDLEPMVAYDTFWTDKELQGQIGLKMNVPVRLARRDGAVAEAQARIGQRRAELAQQVNQVNFEVQQAYARVKESERNVRLYLKTVLPAAEQNVKAAQSAYVTGKIPFLSLIEAERNVIGLRDRYYELVADYFRRLAALERAVGGPVSPWPPAALAQSPCLAPGTPSPPRRFP